MLEKIFKKNEVKFIAIFVIFVFIFLGALFLASIIVDPHNNFGTGIFKPLVMTNRTEKLEALKNLEEKPQILIFGSSRVFSMDPEQIKKITGKSTYNASVSYARAEDYWAMINYIVDDLKITPDTIVIGLNVGAFNNDDPDSQLINNDNLNKYLIGDTAKSKNYLKNFKESINTDYIRDIFISIFKIKYNINKKVLQGGAEFLNNGKIIINQEYNPDSEDFMNTYNRARALFTDQESIDLIRKLYLENTIGYANQRNIKVKLVILPMPTKVLNKLKEETDYDKLYTNFIQYTNELKLAYQFELYDFSTINKFDGLENNFDDATHPGSKNIEKITELIFQEKK